jgi:polyisoprenoid-binding protein YceI
MTVSSDIRRALAAAAAVALAALPSSAGTFRVLADESDLVVVTHRGGFAAKMAHDHVIAASGYEAHLEFAPEAPEAASYRLTVPVDGLVVDDAEVKERLAPRLEELGVQNRPFSHVSDADRAKIRAAMLDPDQLDAEQFPTISAEAVVSGRRETETDGGGPFPYFVRLSLEVRGRTVEREATARYEYQDGKLYVESLASFRFKEFGIRPYSAFLGAVRNRDQFHVYVRIVAAPLEVKPEEP